MDPKPVTKSPSARCGEVMGRKTAECAAICCCCPFAALDLLILTLIKLPAGLCKKAMRKRKRKKQKKRKQVIIRTNHGKVNSSNEGLEGVEEEDEVVRVSKSTVGKSPIMEVEEKAEEMWGRFSNAGFWRSPSQTEDDF